MIALFLLNLLLVVVAVVLFNVTMFKLEYMPPNSVRHNYLNITLVVLSFMLTNIFGMAMMCFLCYTFPSAMLLTNLYLVYLVSKPFLISGMHKIKLF